MKIGAHVSSAKPFSEAVNRANEIGCECMQIFVNPPQRWNPIEIPKDEIDKFVEYNNPPAGGSKIDPILIHGIYLLNLASDNPFFYEQSIKSLIDDMTKAAKIGAIGVNFHIGSTKGLELREVMKKVESAIKRILDGSPEGPYLVLENSAGAGNIIGDTLEELAQIIKAVNSPRLKVLIDTAHAFESGYDWRPEDGVEKFAAKFDQEIGLERLVGFHLNDSKTDLNSKRDRHEDIGCGLIGQDKEVFARILNHSKFKNLFGIIETPGTGAAYEDQIKFLKSMRKS